MRETFRMWAFHFMSHGHSQKHLSLEIVLGVYISIFHIKNLPFSEGDVLSRRVGHVQPLHPGDVFTQVGQAVLQTLLRHNISTGRKHQTRLESDGSSGLFHG